MNDQNQKWFTDRGDETRALDWPINSDSLVWEIGGFEGRWASQMVEKYDCNINIFEPQGWAAQRMEFKFNGNHKVKVYPFGLWVTNESRKLYNFETDGCTIMGTGDAVSLGNFSDIHQWKEKQKEIDVCLMNIEGAEFILIPYMFGIDFMKHFHFFWCQFHPGLIYQGDERANEIFKGMMRTHRKIWDYYPTAVAWERK